jgi:hypothetical protein
LSHAPLADIIVDGLEFTLGHFEEPIWPRTVSTHATKGAQILVYNKEQAIARYKQASLLDCRINAYPDYTEFKGINRQAPNFLFLDLDRSTFSSEKAFNTAFNKTLRNLSDILGAKSPTVLWSGNGYHIYQPLEAFPLEQEELFVSKSAEPSKEFLQFAEQYLTNYKSDPSHHPSFKSCMIRIPGSHNFKLVQKNNDIANESTEVKIKQRWDRVKPKINPLLYHFNIWLADKRIKEINELQSMNKDNRKRKYNNNDSSSHSGSINWIEMLFQTPIADHRKFVSYWILSRYLINIKHANPDEAYAIMKEWSLKCNELEQLSPSIRVFDTRIKNDIKEAAKSGKAPIGKELLKDMNKELYAKLFSTGI